MKEQKNSKWKKWVKWGAIVFIALLLLRQLTAQAFSHTDKMGFWEPLVEVFKAYLY